MLAILYKWIIGNFRQCNHEFEVYKEYKTERNVYIVNRCKICGYMKTKGVI